MSTTAVLLPQRRCRDGVMRRYEATSRADWFKVHDLADEWYERSDGARVRRASRSGRTLAMRPWGAWNPYGQPLAGERPRTNWQRAKSRHWSTAEHAMAAVDRESPMEGAEGGW